MPLGKIILAVIMKAIQEVDPRKRQDAKVIARRIHPLTTQLRACTHFKPVPLFLMFPLSFAPES